MKTYPEIPTGSLNLEVHVFDKLDGSNIRIEWNKKKGFYKYGLRSRLLPPEDPIFKDVPFIFMNEWSEDLRKIFIDNRLQDPITIFMEFWGPSSFAGSHLKDEKKKLTLFDINVYKKGFLSPENYLQLFGDLNIAQYLGKHLWDKNFTEKVRNNDLEGITFEGVVGKGVYKKEIIRAKAKTQKWIDKVKELKINADY